MKKIFLFVLIFSLTASFFANADENETDLYEKYIDVIMEKGEENEKEYIKRGEFIALVMKHFGYTDESYTCSFYDIYESDWDYLYASNAQKRNIVMGSDENLYMSDNDISVEDAVVILSRTHKLNEKIFGEYITDVELRVSDYAKQFVGYALDEGIYPEENNKRLCAKDKIKTKKAIELIKKYDELLNKGSLQANILKGYPKIRNIEGMNSVEVILKVDNPCSVYYAVKEAKSFSDKDILPKENINKFLSSISKTDEEIVLNINLGENKNYDIFFITKSENGKTSGIYTIRNVSLLPFAIGDGTKNNPYHIYTKYQLEQMRKHADKNFILKEDIEYNDTWIPVGLVADEKAFSGTLDGNGHKITGLKIDSKASGGLFYKIDRGTVKNLYLDALVYANDHAGIIAGENEKGTIENCHVTGTVYVNENIAGGIIGRNNGKIINCVSSVYSVEADSYAGGISGTNTGTIKNCLSATYIVNAGMYASGISGVNSDGVIDSCVAANSQIFNSLDIGNGRITTNKENGITIRNYAYSDMYAGDTVVSDKDLKDGQDVVWKELTGEHFYKNVMKWDFLNIWVIDGEPDFLLPYIKSTAKPQLSPGLTIYAPKKITNQEELKNISQNLGGHYILSNDITINELWDPLGESEENAFTGTFDGNGHSIKNLRFNKNQKEIAYALFGVTYGATIKNLNIDGVNINKEKMVASIVGTNYGVIENCSVSGNYNIDNENNSIISGGICVFNYSKIIDCYSRVNIYLNSKSATVGGVAGVNEGFIYDCSYDGEIKNNKKANNVTIGGICGSNFSGFIYNSFSGSYLDLFVNSGYFGGIAGLMYDGEIYCCSTKGETVISGENNDNSKSYAGGICGMISGGIIMNSFSDNNISVYTNTGYIGGIAGYSENMSIQNVYSKNELRHITEEFNENQFVGGLLGYANGGIVLGSVSINPIISANGYVENICAYSENLFMDNNFSSKNTVKNGNINQMGVNGIQKSYKDLTQMDFYFLPIYKNGLLGWLNDKYDNSDVWTWGNEKYPFPILKYVKNQEQFIN